MAGFPTHVVESAFGPGALPRRPMVSDECVCWDGNPDNFEGPQRDCPIHGERPAAQAEPPSGGERP